MSSSLLSNIRPTIWLKVVSKPSSCRLANLHTGFGRSGQPLMKLTCVGINDNFVTKIPVAFMSTPSSSAKTSLDPDKVLKKVEQASDNPPHFTENLKKVDGDEDYALPHPIWSREESENVKIVHRKPVGFVDYMAYYSVSVLRKSFDIASGYTIGKHMNSLDERSVLIRCIFLETVAGVPGFSAAMIRHLHSLRRMQRDHGWIHTLLEEAENERMHLMTFLQLKKPGPFFRGVVIVAQWTFIAMFSSAYLISPNFCHRFVGYLEEQAVVTYTHILEELDKGNLPMWKVLPAPPLAVDYWRLPKDAMMRDVILAIRADEAHHRLVNHTLGSMQAREKNPFKPGQ